MRQEASSLYSFILFVYAHELPSMFFNHHFGLGGKLFVILSFMGTHQGDPLNRPIFILVLSCALQASFVAFPLRFFPLLASDTHIFGLTSFVPFSFDYLNFLANLNAFSFLALQMHNLVLFQLAP